MKTIGSILVWAAAALALAAAPARAHPMPRTHVLLDLDARGITAELQLPMNELEMGYQHPFLDDPRGRIAQYHDSLVAYIGHHVGLVSPDGRAWWVDVSPDLEVTTQDRVPTLVAHLRMLPPDGAPVRRFTLQYDVIQHQLITHRSLVAVRHDWDGGAVAGPPNVLAEIGYPTPTLVVDLPPGSAWRGFASVVRLGMRHIAEGTDHLLFLLVLLLPAALVPLRGTLVSGRADSRWGGYAGVRPSVRYLVRVVTAFTLGHSLTLAAGAVGLLRLPSRPVETLIALSILVSALHALKPLFAGREALVSGGFGLVHGLAFASVVAEFGLDPWHLTLSILGFNVGIELMQLTVVAVAVPWLLVLARTRAYAFVRVPGAVVAGAAAVAWMLERALGWANPVGPRVEAVAAHPAWIVGALAGAAVVATLVDARRAPTPPPAARSVSSPLPSL
ncbi:membrane protein [Gemmatimonadetes bacterium T265]|nr:membrane protein [Gemmatimonadetes bacterium T265]